MDDMGIYVYDRIREYALVISVIHYLGKSINGHLPSSTTILTTTINKNNNNKNNNYNNNNNNNNNNMIL